MPSRPRAHELESESLQAFRSAIPSSWVVRTINPDYGIDAEVEIFESGKASGLTFKVQLKGTDKTGSPPKMKVGRIHLNYWRGLDIPVLVVKFVAPRSELFWAWAHDPIFKLPIDVNQKTFTAKYSTSMSSREMTPEILRSQVERWRERRRGDLSTPIMIQADLTKLSHDRVSEVRSGFADASRDMGGLAQITTDRRIAHQAVVKIDENSITLCIVIGVSVTINDYLCDFSTGADVLSLFALCLFMEGRQTAIASQIAACALKSSTVVAYTDAAFVFAELLAAGGLFADLQKIAVLERLEESPAAVVYRLALVRYLGTTPGALETWASSERVAVRELESSNQIEEAARRSYGLGNILRTSGFWPEAIVELEGAARLDSSYLRRGYWWREIGGSSFLLGDFSRAISEYKKAVELGEADAHIGLTDALMYNGNYEEAGKIVDGLIEGSGHWQSEARFKRALLDRAFKFGIQNQDRQIEAALTALQQGNVDIALGLDFLCGLAWMTRAHNCALNGGDPIPDLRLAVATDVTDVFNKAALILECLSRPSNDEYEQVLADAIAISRRSNDEVREVLRYLAEDQADEVADLFDGHPAEVDMDTAITLRVFGEDSENPEFLIRAPSERIKREQL